MGNDDVSTSPVAGVSCTRRSTIVVVWYRATDDVEQPGVVAGDDVDAGRIEVSDGRLVGRPGAGSLDVDDRQRRVDAVDGRQRDVLPLDGLGHVQQTRHVADRALCLETQHSALVRRAANNQ